MCAKATLEIIFPLALIFLISSDPVHRAFSISFVVLPFTFIEISGGIGHLAFTAFLALQPFSIINGTVAILELAVSVTQSRLPITLIFDTFLWVDVGAFSMSEAILNLSFEEATIWPFVTAIPSNFVFCEFAFVNRSIYPGEFASSLEQAVAHFSAPAGAVGNPGKRGQQCRLE